MNREGDANTKLVDYVPRASGDEPDMGKLAPDFGVCSPRERG